MSENPVVQNSPSQTELLLAYYGDDFTGSTDALECLALAGLRTMLFLQPPTRERLAALPALDAIGVAGRSRSLPTAVLATEVPPALSLLRELNPRHLHYKVCSTFDSSFTVGSIGRVIDESARLFPAPFVPLVVGAPPLGRWCVFGNLYAQVAIGNESEVCRLDRHPTMRNHPTTPADESDLRLHLARQTNKSIALFDIRQIDLPIDQAAVALTKLLERRPDIVLFDVLHDGHLRKIGALIDSYAEEHAPLFSVGSSGVEMALAAHWTEECKTQSVPREKVSRSDPVLVLSGSCSPVTTAQIEFALAHGFGNVPLDTDRLLNGGESEQPIDKASEEAMLHLAAGRSVVVHTHPGLAAPSVTNRQHQTAEILGTALGGVLAACASQGKTRRVCIAGGDTASYVARAIGVDSLTMIAPFTRGAPLCRVQSHRPEIDGLETVFKAGQVGGPDLFLQLVEGAV
jgi:uncharacterized protein YgbK (DUF1537 family)